LADWYEKTMLATQWNCPRERFSSQAFWDAFEHILPQSRGGAAQDPLESAQMRVLGLWKEQQLVCRRLLAYDTTKPREKSTCQQMGPYRNTSK
jgi:hypothetical protein